MSIAAGIQWHGTTRFAPEQRSGETATLSPTILIDNALEPYCHKRKFWKMFKTYSRFILASAYYLLYFGAVGSLQPYLNLYYQERGMSHQEIGYLAAMLTAVGILAAPVWTGIADSYRLHRSILLLAMVGTLLPIWLLSQAQVFWTLAASLFLYVLFLSPIVPLADNAILAMFHDRNRYGQVRLWGSVGWAIAVQISGILVEDHGLRMAFYIFLGVMFLNIFITARLPVPEVAVKTTSYFADMKVLLRNSAWAGLLAVMFLQGTALNMMINYLVIYMKELGAGERLIGLSVAIAAASELPIFFLAPFLLKKLTPRGLLSVALAMLAVRAFIYALIPTPEWALVGQLLHGPIFAGQLAAAMAFVIKLTPPALGASAQATLGMATYGMGGVAGALMGARLYDTVGPVLMFCLTGLVALAAFCLFQLLNRLQNIQVEQVHQALSATDY